VNSVGKFGRLGKNEAREIDQPEFVLKKSGKALLRKLRTPSHTAGERKFVRTAEGAISNSSGRSAML